MAYLQMLLMVVIVFGMIYAGVVVAMCLPIVILNPIFPCGGPRFGDDWRAALGGILVHAALFAILLGIYFLLAPTKAIIP